MKGVIDSCSVEKRCYKQKPLFDVHHCSVGCYSNIDNIVTAQCSLQISAVIANFGCWTRSSCAIKISDACEHENGYDGSSEFHFLHDIPDDIPLNKEWPTHSVLF